MFCKNCGNQVPEGNSFCMQCGAKIEAEVAEPAVTSAPAENEVVENQVVEDIIAEPAPEVVEKPKKKFNPLKVLIPAGAAVVVAAVALLVGFNWVAVKGFFIKTFGSDEAYLKHVEYASLAEMGNSVTNVYESAIYNSFDGKDKNAQVGIEFTVTDDAKKMLSDLYGEDFDWFENVKLLVNSSSSDKLAGGEGTLSLNGDEIAAVKALVSTEDGEIYFTLPGLTDKYVLFDFDSNIDPDMQGALAEMSGVISDLESKVLPNKKEIDALYKKYIKIALDNVTDVKKSKDTVEFGGVEQKVTVLKAEITQKTVIKMSKDVLKEAKSDKEIKKIIKRLCDFLEENDVPEVDFDDIYDMYQDAIEEAIEEMNEAMEYIEDDETLIEIIDYVDGASKIIGRKIKDADGDTVVVYGVAKKGRNLGIEIKISDMVVIEGKGKLTGKKFTGDLDVKANDEKILNIEISDFDMVSVKDGYLNGKITVYPADSLIEMANMSDMIDELGEDVRLGLSLDFAMKKKEAAISVALVDDGDGLVSLKVTANEKGDVSLDKPSESKTVDFDNIDEWAEGLDIDKLESNIKKAGIPDEVMESIGSMFEGGMGGNMGGNIESEVAVGNHISDDWGYLAEDDVYDFNYDLHMVYEYTDINTQVVITDTIDEGVYEYASRMYDMYFGYNGGVLLFISVEDGSFCVLDESNYFDSDTYDDMIDYISSEFHNYGVWDAVYAFVSYCNDYL